MSSAHRLHPEFGFFCPSSRFRRTAKRTLVLAVGGVLIGLFALKAVYEPSQAGALPVAAGTQPTSSTTPKVALEPSTAASLERPSPPPVVTVKPESSRLPSGKTAAQTAEAARPRPPRAANESPPIAAITVGRGELPPASPSAATAELDGGPKPASPPAVAVQPVVRSAPLSNERPAKLPEPPRTIETATPSPQLVAPAAPASPTKVTPAKTSTRSAKVPAEPPSYSDTSDRPAASGARKRGVAPEAVKTVSREVRSRDSHRSARVSVAPPEKRVLPPSRTSVTKLATQVRQCVETGNCRASEQLLRSLLSTGM
jgi:hypothetical protein